MKIELLKQKIDYDKPIKGSNLDYVTYNKKFKLFDYILENGLLDKHESNCWALLEDLTFYAYAFLQDPEGGNLKLTCYQDAIAGCRYKPGINPELDPNRLIIFRSANQIGKSLFLDAFAIQKVFLEENINIVLVSKSLPQSQFLLASIRHLLNNSKFSETWKMDLGETANTTQLTFTRNKGKIINRLICAPSGEGLLGYPVHYLLLDEFDFYEDGKRFFEKVAYPRTNKTKGQIICFSNPNADVPLGESILYQLWHGDLFKRKFHFNFLDAPWNSKSKFDLDRRNISETYFMSTHLGEFSEESGSFLTTSQIEYMLDKDLQNTPFKGSDRPVYISVDLGKMNDNTVIGVGIAKEPKDSRDKFPDIEILWYEVVPLGTSYDTIANKLGSIIDFYEGNYSGISDVGFDATGQKTFGDMLTAKGIYAMPIDFSRKETNKTKLYRDFQMMAQNRKIKMPYTDLAKKQFNGLTFKVTESGKFRTVENKTDTIHDDVPDMTVMMCHICARIGVITPGVTIL